MSNSISLDEYIRARAYYKNETYTQMEVMNAISSYPLVKIVRELPTDDIIANQLYLVVNDANLPNEKMNKYDLFIHLEDGWEQVDSLEFNIEDYPTKTELDYELGLKADINHGHDNVDVSRQSDGFISWEQQRKLNTVEEGANKTIIDSTPTQNSNNAVTSGSVYQKLSEKAPNNHRSKNSTYGVSDYEYYGHSKSGITVPPMNTTNGSVGTDNGLYARADHTHPTDTSRASNSPATRASAGLMSASDKIKLDNIIIDDNLTNNNHLTKNSGVKSYVDNALEEYHPVTIDDNVTRDSNNPVSSKGIKIYVDNAIGSIHIDGDDLIEKLNTLITDMRSL